MRESDIEQYLCLKIKQLGGLCEKFVSPQRRYVPDRLVTYNGEMYMVELKAPGEVPNDGQLRDHVRRKDCGVIVHVIDSYAQADIFIEQLSRMG